MDPLDIETRTNIFLSTICAQYMHDLLNDSFPV